MAASIDATVAGANANSYVTVAEATTYFEARQPSTEWDNADADERIRALISATRRLDQEHYVGSTVNPLTGTSDETMQALKWPRYSAISDEGWTYKQDVIPEPVKRAQMELAYVILGDDAYFDNTGLEGFNSAKVGPLEVDIRHQQVAGELPEHVRREIQTLLRGSAVTVPLLRG